MAIFKTAIKGYLNRELRNLNEMKEWSPAKVERKLAALQPQPVFVTQPRLHQKVCFLLLANDPQTLQLLGMGLGKTKLVLDVFRWYKSAGKMKRLLVLVPNVVNLESWRNEIALHAPDLSAVYVEGPRSNRQEALYCEESDLCVTTYAGLNSLLCDRVRKKMQPNYRVIQEVQKLFGGVVLDEITGIMNHRSLSFRIVSRLSSKWLLRVGLTGTPLGRDPMVLWSQFFAVDRGEALGKTIGMFREAFFTHKPGYWGGTEYEFQHRMTGTLRRMMAHSAISYSSQECIDLPPKVAIKAPVVMSEEAWAYYHAVLDQARERDVESVIDIENVFIRLRQITSGFVSIDGKPSPLKENPKLDALMELVEELPVDDKLVVFNEFVASGDFISAALKERGIKHARLYSGTRDKRAELRRFLDDPQCRVFVVNSRSGAMGLNLQVAHYVAVYESPVSPIVRQQAEARCLRQGQKETVFIYDLLCRGTVDSKILGFLAEGRDLFRALVEGGLRVLEHRKLL
jgi:SNF2 family DNA or RNA helicase